MTGTRFSRPSARSRPKLAVSLLLLAFGLTGVLALQAHRADAEQRAAKERALDDYAAFAAWGFGRYASEHLHTALYNSLDLVRTEVERGGLPAPSLLAEHPKA